MLLWYMLLSPLTFFLTFKCDHDVQQQHPQQWLQQGCQVRGEGGQGHAMGQQGGVGRTATCSSSSSSGDQ
jgi:hypothetical protein